MRSNLAALVVVVACGPSPTPVEAPRGEAPVSVAAEAPVAEVPVEAATPADDGADAAIATARTALTAQGLPAEWLHGEVQVRAIDERYELRFVPTPATGAPDHVEAFVDLVAHRLLDVDVLAGLAGMDGHQGVPVVGRADDDGV